MSCLHKKKETSTLYRIEKDSSVSIFVKDTAKYKQDSLSYPSGIVCDTCIDQDIALDSIQASFYTKELNELDIAKGLYTIKKLKKEVDVQLVLYKKYSKLLKDKNSELEKVLNTKVSVDTLSTVTSDSLK